MRSGEFVTGHWVRGVRLVSGKLGREVGLATSVGFAEWGIGGGGQEYTIVVVFSSVCSVFGSVFV